MRSTSALTVLPGIKTDDDVASSPRPRPSRACTFATEGHARRCVDVQGRRSGSPAGHSEQPTTALRDQRFQGRYNRAQAVRPSRCDMGFTARLRRRAIILSGTGGNQASGKKLSAAFDSYLDRTSLSWA